MSERFLDRKGTTQRAKLVYREPAKWGVPAREWLTAFPRTILTPNRAINEDANANEVERKTGTPHLPAARAPRMTDAPSDRRLRAPASARNQDPIRDVLRARLPPSGLVLEIASGTGEHVVHFAAALPGLVFQPSDVDARCRESVAAWVTSSDLSNIRPVRSLDVTLDWAAQIPGGPVDAVLCINMIHITPWEATLGLMDGASKRLYPGGVLFLYGPFKRNGVHTAPTNAVFDERLRAQDPSWGIRDLGEVTAVAVAAGFNVPEVIEMPSNNLSVLFRLAG